MIKYPLKFKAAILEEKKKPLVLDEVLFEGPLQTGQVLTKINYSGICSKQIEEIEEITRPDPYLPHMLGHEGGGIVLDTGPGVKKVSQGDKVVLHWMQGNGIESDTPFYVRDGSRVNAGLITTFNEYGVISENRITKVSKDTNLELACLLGCCTCSGVGLIFNETDILPEDSVAVFGCGGVGLNVIQGAKLKHAYPIIAVDVNEESLKLAKMFGATHTINSLLTEPIAKIKSLTNPYEKEIKDAKSFKLKEAGADYIICAVSNPKAIEQAVHSSAIPGKVYLAGVPPYNSTINLKAFDIHAKRNIYGSSGGGVIPERDIPKYLKLYKKGLLMLDELISNRVSLEEINKGIDLVKSGKIGRCIVDMI